MPREDKIAQIKKSIIEEMGHPTIDTTLFKTFLQNLKDRTNQGWRHKFVTTNWDCLLEREINALNLEVEPPWLASTHVYHVNGTVDDSGDNSFDSPFLLEDDPCQQRISTPEANIISNYMIWDTIFFVIGMSFECEMDRFLLASLNKVEGDLPIGSSIWLVINPDKETLETSSSNIASALPRAKVYTTQKHFEEWMNEGMLPLKQLGAFAF